MILRRYGSTIHSVEINFSAHALNEINFRRDRERSISTEEFESDWVLEQEYAMDGLHEGWVQGEVEQKMLDDMEADIRALVAEMDDEHILVIESEQGTDWPKARGSQSGKLVDGHNKLYFKSWVEPPLRLGRYRKID